MPKEKHDLYWDKMNEVARKNGGLDDGWHIGELLGSRNGTIIVMYQCPLKTRGPNKGMPNYRKATEKAKVLLTQEDSKAIQKEVYGE